MQSEACFDFAESRLSSRNSNGLSFAKCEKFRPQVKQAKLWMLVAILTICGTSVLTSCSNDDNPTEQQGEYTGDNSKSPANPKRSITPEQFQNRMILRQAMLRHGFKPFDTEWWHFTLKDEPFPDTYFTFPVKQLSK